jgi:glycosyltransferase involved in cell wall biosynthesis
VRQPNAGHAAALNRGIAEARFEWIARMDHDDRCAPDRLGAQRRFLVEHPDVHLLGSHATEIDEMGRSIGYLSIGPASAAEFAALRASNDVIALIHPSVMFRRDTVLSVGGYRVPDSFADIDLWSRVADQHRVMVIARPLIEYRVHAASMTNARFMEMQRGLRLVRARQAARRRGAPEPSYDEFAATERQQTLPGRLARGRTDWALLLSKRALTHWNSGRRSRALIELSGSCALRPVASARRVTQRVMRARTSQS